MKRRLAFVAVLGAFVAAYGALAATAEAAPPKASATVAISPTQSEGILDGVFEITEVTVNSAGELVAEGVFTGTAIIDGVVHEITTTASVVLSAAQATGSCTILDLDVGAIHLDVLGLVIDLSDVHLDVTAVTGSGKLLGNLLCAVAGLLDGGLLPTAIQRLLDLINGLLG